MRTSWTRVTLLSATVGLVLAAAMPSAHAIHFYRGPGGGCTPADGALTDDPEGTQQNVAATVVLGHNTFSAGMSGFSASPVETRVKAGESVRWTWNSSHCHSVTSDAEVGGKRLFESGFHYPTTAPESQAVASGVFHYPELDDTPTLSYTRTFPTPGTYTYFCVHHASIGMRATVIVEA